MRIRSLLVCLLLLPVLAAAEGTPPSGWKEYAPKDRSFSVWLPEKSNRRSERERTATVRGVRMKINLISVEIRGGLTYEASTLTLPARMVRTIRPSEKLEIIRDVFLSEVRGKVANEVEVKDGAATGKEYTIQTGSGMARLRVFARGGRLYRASVMGNAAQVASKNADTFLQSFTPSTKAPEPPAETPAEKAPDKTGSADKTEAAGLQWLADAAKMKIPDAPVAGKLGGSSFKVDEAKYIANVSVLSLEKGKGEGEIKFFLFIKRGEKLENQTFKINARGKPGERRPAVHIMVKAADGKEKRAAYTGNYAMLLEFGKEMDGKVPGKIYLCLSDEDKSVVAGTFAVKPD